MPPASSEIQSPWKTGSREICPPTDYVLLPGNAVAGLCVGADQVWAELHPDPHGHDEVDETDGVEADAEDAHDAEHVDEHKEDRGDAQQGRRQVEAGHDQDHEEDCAWQELKRSF